MTDWTLDFVKEVAKRKMEDKMKHTSYPSAEYAAFVKLARLDRKMGRDTLARYVGVSPVFIALLETRWLRKDELTPEHILLLDVFLGISYEYFMKTEAERVRDYLAEQQRLDMYLNLTLEGINDDPVLPG